MSCIGIDLVNGSHGVPAVHRFSPIDPGREARGDRDLLRRSHGCPIADVIHPAVEISPPDIVRRRAITWHGMTAETVQSTSQANVKYRFRAPMHLLVAYEEGERSDGETFVEGLPRSTLRNFAAKLTFVPAGHEYHESQKLRTHARLMYFYFDPAKLKIRSDLGIADISFAPRLLWGIALKLKHLVESPASADQLYFEALGFLLVHELARLNRGTPSIRPQIRGGIAAWQQRIVTDYIKEHLADQVPLAALAQLVGLSPYYFCHAFKQSFGVPPHRYHMGQRVKRAKELLAQRTSSVTHIGMTLGFSQTSSFSAAFRKAIGLTPTNYQRSLG
jgi:AraC family transcriptional regulator